MGGGGTNHSGNALHDDQNDDAQTEKGGKDDHQIDGAADARFVEGRGHGHGPEHGRELLVGKREGPQAEVRGRVRDAVEAEFCWFWLVLLCAYMLLG